MTQWACRFSVVPNMILLRLCCCCIHTNSWGNDHRVCVSRLRFPSTQLIGSFFLFLFSPGYTRRLDGTGTSSGFIYDRMRKLGKRRRKTHQVIPKNGFRGPAVHSASHFCFFRGLYGPVPRLFLTGRINYLVCTFTSFHSFLHHQKRRILLLHLKKKRKNGEKKTKWNGWWQENGIKDEPIVFLFFFGALTFYREALNWRKILV